MGLTEQQKTLEAKLRRIAGARIVWQNQLARPEQLPPPGDWSAWLIISGRGWGKTRTGAEWLAWQAVSQPGTRWAIVAATFGDARDTCVEGDSGLLNILRRYSHIKKWNRSLGEIQLTNGSLVKLFSADEPDRLRGPQFHGAWCDELAAWKYIESWDQLQFGLRLGKKPQVLVTTTPRPIPIIQQLVKRDDGSVVITRGATFDNAKNLAPSALAQLLARYDGTRLGRQELYGEVLTDIEGALWSMSMIENARMSQATMDDDIRIVRRVIAVDPAITSHEDSDETGIVVASRDADGQLYVEFDGTMKGRPDEWARRVVALYDEYECDSAVIEVNQGGDMVESTLRTVRNTLSIRKVRASKGKRMRAEPISALYEQGRVHHIGKMDKLEDQMCSWSPDDLKSPDRLDALVWALTDLLDAGGAEAYLRQIAKMCECGYPNLKSAATCYRCSKSL
jgi:phage terminase large subunit-like protein